MEENNTLGSSGLSMRRASRVQRRTGGGWASGSAMSVMNLHTVPWDTGFALLGVYADKPRAAGNMSRLSTTEFYFS